MGLDTYYPVILSSLIKSADIKTVLELGVCSGNSTTAILEALPSKGRLWSVDIDKCEGTKNRLKERFGDKWTFLSETDDLLLEWDRVVDMIFIDTSHLADHTLKELIKYSPYAKRFLVLHDTISNPPVMDVIRGYLKDDINWAWAEWKHNYGLAMLMRIVK